MRRVFRRGERVYSPKGRLVHRASGETMRYPTLCRRVPFWHQFLDAEADDAGARRPPCQECEARR